VKCPRCQQENPPQAKFCLECATPLALRCANCGTQLPPGAKFCFECAAPVGAPGSSSRFASPESYTPKHLAEKILTSKGALEGERKQVTVLFADLKGSMELLADRDPEEARKLLDPVLERMMEAVHRYEGTVNQVMGDGIMALFGAPLGHEDHARRACYAALRMQESVNRYSEQIRRSHGVEVQIRVGLNSGEVVVRSIGSDLHMDYTAVGQTTHLAARMEQLASPGSIRLTAATLRLAEGYVDVKLLGPVPVKGLSEPVDVYEAIGAGTVRSRLQAAAARGLSPFVGREAEIDQLRKALEHAVLGHGQLVAVVGEPGVGKSRLFYEFAHSHPTRGWLILESGSVSYSKATSYLPVIDLLKAYFKVHDRETHREIREKVTGKLLTLDRALESALPALLALLDLPVEDIEWAALDPPQRRWRTLDAVKRLLLCESRIQPLLMIIEDLHWIDGETAALLDDLIDSLPTARFLLLVNYRPEYQHAWGSKTYYTQLRLDALPPESADELLQALLGADTTVEPLKPILIARTGGNPLFLEESVRTLVETNALVGERGACRLARPLGTIAVPATVQAILASRIDRLDSQDKQLLQTASVVGKDVPFALLLAVAELPEEDLRRGLGHLEAAEFLYEANLFPDLEYTFKHALTRDVAYGGLLHERRRTLHARIVAAIEALHQDRLGEQIERLAHHALRGELREKAVHFQLKLGEVLRASKGSGADETAQAFARAVELCHEVGDRSRMGPALTGLWSSHLLRAKYSEARALADELSALAGADPNPVLGAFAARAVGMTAVHVGDFQAARTHLEHGLTLFSAEEHYLEALREYGVNPRVSCLAYLGRALWSLGYPDQALARNEEAVEEARARGSAFDVTIALSMLTSVRQLRGELAEMREATKVALEQAREQGVTYWLVRNGLLLQWVEAMTAAEREQGKRIAEFRDGLERYRRTGTGLGISWLLGLLAQTLAAAGQPLEGLRVLDNALAHVEKTGECFDEAELRGLQGELTRLAGGTDAHMTAETRFRHGLDIARAQRARGWELAIAGRLARLLHEQGRDEEARNLLQPVYAWFTEGLETADVRSARALLDELRPSAAGAA
jgi:class 3 adenylate cyclase/predicted ATPase